MKKYILISYFVFYRYYSKLDRKNDSKNKNTWDRCLLVMMLPFGILCIPLLDYLSKILVVRIPSIIIAICLFGLSYYLFSTLLFKVYNLDKNKDVSQQAEIKLNRYSFIYPLILYIIVISIFFYLCYLKNGYLIKG